MILVRFITFSAHSLTCSISFINSDYKKTKEFVSREMIFKSAAVLLPRKKKACTCSSKMSTYFNIHDGLSISFDVINSAKGVFFFFFCYWKIFLISFTLVERETKERERHMFKRHIVGMEKFKDMNTLGDVLFFFLLYLSVEEIGFSSISILIFPQRKVRNCNKYFQNSIFFVCIF